MGKIFKKVVSLLLGAILGISSVLATVVTAGYYMYSELPVGNIVAPGKEEDLGTVGDFSIEDILDLLQQGSTAPENYTIADLKEKYGLDIIGLINSLGGDEPLIDENDKQFIADLESVSIFTLFSDEGLMRFLSDLPMGAVLGFIPEESFLSKTERDKLRGYSLGQLIAKDEATGQIGLLSALSEIKLGGVLPSMFEYVGDGEYIAKEDAPKFLNLLANVEFGAFINVVLGETTFGDELVEGGLSSIGDMSVGEIMSQILGEESDLATKMDNLFNNIDVKDLFEKDMATGSYKFVVEKLLDNVKVGAILGYEKDEDGNWVTEDEEGNVEPVGGLMGALASLDLTTLYQVFTSDAPVSEKIHNALLVLGDVTVGDVFEMLGYKQEEGVWLNKDGEPVTKLLEVIFSISIEDIVGEQGTELSLKNVRINLTQILAENCGDLTLGEGLADLFGVELDENGKFVYTDGEKAGEKVNVFMQSLLGIKVADVVDSFGGETVELDNLVKVLEGALAGASVGDVIGAEKQNGKWVKDGEEIGAFASILYDMSFAGIFAVIKQLGAENFSYAAIVEGLFPDLAVGDIATAISEKLTREDVSTTTIYYLDGTRVEDGLNTILNLKLWQVIAGLDENHPYNLKEVIKDIPLGEVLNLLKQKNGTWRIADDRVATGSLAALFDFTLGELLSDEEGVTKDKLTETLKAVELGDVFTFALGFDPATGKFISTEDGVVPNRILVALCNWDFSINDIISIVNGDTSVDATFIRTELKDLLGAIPFGETFRGLLTDFAEDDSLTMSVLPQLSGLLDPVFNATYAFYIDLIFDIVDGKELKLVEVLRSVYGDTTLGDIIAPIVNLTKNDEKIYVTEGGKSLGVGLTDLLDTVIVDVIEVLLDKENSDKLSTLFNDHVVDIDNEIGDFLTLLGVEAGVDGWFKKDGSKIEYEPVLKILNVNILELVNTLVLDSNKTGEEKRDYVINIFENITLGDFLSPISAIAESDKYLLVKLLDTRIDTLILDILGKELKVLEIVEKNVGDIAIGDLVNLIGATERDGVWSLNDKELPQIASNLFNVNVSTILDWVESRFDKPTISSIVYTINGDFTVLDHVNDITNKDGLNNKGLDKLLSLIKLTELTDVLLGLKTDYTNEMSDDPVIAYLLNITDQVFFGDLFNLNSNDTHDKWYNANGSEVTGIMNTVYSQPLSIVLYLIAIIMDPNMALEMIRPVKLGDLLKDPYNNLAFLDSEIVGEGEEGGAPYVVNGAFKFFMEDVANLSFGDMIDSAFERGTPVDDLKRFMLDRPLGDYLFDLFSTILLKEKGNLVGFKGYGSDAFVDDKYTVTANFAEVINVVLNLNVATILKQSDKKAYLKSEVNHLLIGDLLYDVTRKLLENKFHLGTTGTAYAHKQANKGYHVEVNFAEVINATFNIPVIELIDNIKNIKDYLKGKYNGILIGDLLYDVSRKLLENKFHLGTTGTAYAHKQANGGYHVEVNFAEVINATFNIPVIELIDNIKNIKDYLKGKYNGILIGDLLYDVSRKLLENKFHLGTTGTAYAHKQANKGYHVTVNLAEVINATFNIPVIELIDNIKNIKGYAEKTYKDISFGDLLYDVMRKVLKTGNRFGIEGVACESVDKDGKYHLEKAVLFETIFNINVFALINSGNIVQFMKTTFAKVSIGDVANLLKPVEFDGEQWLLNGEPAKHVYQKLFKITVEEILGWVGDLKIKVIIKDVLEDLTFGQLLIEDFNVEIFKKDLFDCLEDEAIADVIIYIIDRDFKNLKLIIGKIAIGDVANLVMGVTDEDDDGKWLDKNGKDTLIILNNVFNIHVSDILDWADNRFDKPTISTIVHTLDGDNDLLTLANDITKKDGFGNNAINKALDLITLSEFVDVALGIKTDVTNKMSNAPLVAYVLNITDEIFFGDFLNLKSSEDHKQWYNASDAEIKGIMNTVYGIPVSYVLYVVAAIVNPQLIVDAIGDNYIGTFIKEPYNKFKIDSTISGDNDKGYTVEGAFKEVVEDVANVKVKTIYDDIRNNKFVGKVKDTFLNREIGDYLFDLVVQFVYKTDKKNLGFEGYASDKVVDGKYSLEKAYKRIFDKVLNLNLQDTINGLKTNKKWVNDFMSDVLLGDVLFDFLRRNFSKVLLFCNDGVYGYTQVVDGKYVLDRNFKDVLEPLFNVAIGDILGKKNMVDFFINEVYPNLLIGDVLYDPMRKLTRGKVNIGLDGLYAFKNKEENGGKYFADQNFSAIISQTFNLGIKEIYDAYRNKYIKAVIHNTYKDLTLGDLFYDVFRKFVSKKLSLKAYGYAWQIEEQPTLVQGKIAKLVRAVCAVTLDDVYQVYKKKITRTKFAVDAIGHLTLGDVIAPFVEKYIEKSLQAEFVYDEANDYALTVEKNFAELLNTVFGVSMKKMLTTKKIIKVFFGADGVLEDMPAGHVVGYLAKTKMLSKTFKKTTFEHVYGGEWIVGGVYEVPMNILCNDVTLGTLYSVTGGGNRLKNDLLIPYFGKVELGHFAGGKLVDGVWYKSNGEPHPTLGAKNVIMVEFYNVMLEEVLAKGFDPTKVIEDVFAGQVMGYYRCGEFKFAVDSDGTYGICVDDTHVNNKGAYHLHDGDTTKYTVVEDGEFTYCEEAHVDDMFAYHTHFICEIEAEGHNHEDMGKGWYYLEDGQYKKAGAIENAVANLTLKTLMAGRFSMAETLRGVKLGEAMNLVYCDESGIKCPVTELDPTHVCEEGWYEKSTTGGVTTYVKAKLVLEKIADIDLYELFTNGLDLTETFSGTYVGDVLGYEHCYINGAGERVCSEALGHGDTDHKTNNMWYIENDSDDDGVIDGFRKATPLERTFASVAMSKIINGEFDVEKELESITLGEFMSYEKCTGDENCFVHPNGCTHDDTCTIHPDPCTHAAECPVHPDGWCCSVWYNEEDDGTYTVVTNNLVLAIADYDIKDMQDPNFADTLLTSVQNKVSIGDVFGNTDGTPLSLLDPGTKIGNINEDLVTVFETATAGEMYDAGVLPFDNATFTKMDEVFGGLIMIDIQSTTPGDAYDRIDNSKKCGKDEFGNDITYGDLMQAAIDAHDVTDYDTEDDYVRAVGETFWMSLTANALVDILIDAINI